MKPAVFRAVISGSVALAAGLLLLHSSCAFLPFGLTNGDAADAQRPATSLHYALVYCRPISCTEGQDAVNDKHSNLLSALRQHPLQVSTASPSSLVMALVRHFPDCQWECGQAGSVALDGVAGFGTMGRASGGDVETAEYRTVARGQVASDNRYFVTAVNYRVHGGHERNVWIIGADVDRKVLKTNRSRYFGKFEVGSGSGTVRIVKQPAWHLVCTTGPAFVENASWSGQHMVFVSLQ